jgi:hypothetical protein
VGGAHLVGQIEPHRRYAEGFARRVALDARVLRPETAHPEHRDLFPVAVESEQFLLRTRKERRNLGVGAVQCSYLGAGLSKDLEIEEFVCACIFTDRLWDLPSLVSDHEGMKIIDRLPEQVAGIETVGAQYLKLDNSHRPEEEQGEGHDVNRHYQQQDSSPVARNTSRQPLQDIEASGT